MEKLKGMKDCLVNAAQSQVYGNLATVDTKELGEVIDMIKDLEEAIYYCTVTEAMEEHAEGKEYKKEGSNGNGHMYYPYDYNMMYYPPYRDMDRSYGRMYYNGNGQNSGGSSQGGNSSSQGGNSGGGQSGYESRYPMEIRDYREGRSPMARRSYMESKEMHKDKNTQIQELDKYMKELSEDITEMIKEATPEERTMLQQKLTTLAAKVK